MKTLDLSVLPPEAWRPVETATGRISNRISERELEKIPTWINLSGDKPASENGLARCADIRVTLWDYSPFGFAVIFSHAKANSICIKEGDRVQVKIELGGGQMVANCLVRNTTPFKNGLRIGLSRRDLVRKTQVMPQIGVPVGECLRIPSHADIRAETANPILYGEWSSMRMYGLRPGLQIEMLSTDTALALFMGQKLDIHLTLPTSGNNTYLGEIIALERLRGDTIRLRMKPVNLSVGLANDLAELLAFEAGVSPETLKRYGFPIRFFRNRLTFRFVDDMEDYAKVLHLRRNAYVEVGKREQETTPEEMSIDWDKSSRILCAFHDDVLVASAALTFPSKESDTLRSETAFPGNKFPGNPPKKSELLEVNSLCTHKDYRRGDLLKAVFEHIARIFILSDRNYIMNLSDSTLLPIYLSIGFKNMHETGMFLGREHHLIKITREAVTKSRGLWALVWNNLYGDLMEDVLKTQVMEFTPWERFMLKLRLAMKPLAKQWLGAGQEKSFQRKVEEAKKG